MIGPRLVALAVLGLVLFALAGLMFAFRHQRPCILAPIVIPTSSGPALEPTPPGCISRGGRP